MAGHALQEEPDLYVPAAQDAHEFVEVQPTVPHAMQPNDDVMPLHVELPEQQTGYEPLETHAARARAATSARTRKIMATNDALLRVGVRRRARRY